MVWMGATIRGASAESPGCLNVAQNRLSKSNSDTDRGDKCRRKVEKTGPRPSFISVSYPPNPESLTY